MRSDGIVICVMAHAIKWPPAIRHFHRGLLQIVRRPIKAAEIVTAYHEAVKWADGKTLKNMHAGLSIAKRSHATSGLMVTAKQLRLITPIVKSKAEDVVVRLGITATSYALKPRRECTDCVAIVRKFLDYAEVVEIKWPCPGGAFEDLAGQMFDLMVYMHALKSSGFGLGEGRKIVGQKQTENRTVAC